MSSEPVVEFSGVWKKYRGREVFHGSIRDDIARMFKRGKTRELDKDEFWALSDVSLTAARGECVGIFGPNGSGKTTILKIIASVTHPTLGTVSVRGRVAPMIALGAGFHPDLTGMENIYVNGTILGMSLREVRRKIGAIVEFSELADFIDMPVRKYSSGMHLKLGFSIALHSSAGILLMDEILAVGDEVFTARCIDGIRRMRDAGRTIIFVTHNRALMDRVVDRVVFLKKGRISDAAG
jgi:ABC-type polysaccharide/polyol phosphate transport system ATPase subunit